MNSIYVHSLSFFCLLFCTSLLQFFYIIFGFSVIIHTNQFYKSYNGHIYCIVFIIVIDFSMVLKNAYISTMIGHIPYDLTTSLNWYAKFIIFNINIPIIGFFKINRQNVFPKRVSLVFTSFYLLSSSLFSLYSLIVVISLHSSYGK